MRIGYAMMDLLRRPAATPGDTPRSAVHERPARSAINDMLAQMVGGGNRVAGASSEEAAGSAINSMLASPPPRDSLQLSSRSRSATSALSALSLSDFG